MSEGKLKNCHTENIISRDCHVRTSSFLAMTVVIDTWLHISEKLVKYEDAYTTSCGHPKERPEFLRKSSDFFRCSREKPVV